MWQLSLDDNLKNAECDREILNYLGRAPHKNVNIFHQTHSSNTFLEIKLSPVPSKPEHLQILFLDSKPSHSKSFKIPSM